MGLRFTIEGTDVARYQRMIGMLSPVELKKFYAQCAFAETSLGTKLNDNQRAHVAESVKLGRRAELPRLRSLAVDKPQAGPCAGV